MTTKEFQLDILSIFQRNQLFGVSLEVLGKTMLDYIALDNDTIFSKDLPTTFMVDDTSDSSFEFRSTPVAATDFNSLLDEDKLVILLNDISNTIADVKDEVVHDTWRLIIDKQPNNILSFTLFYITRVK